MLRHLLFSGRNGLLLLAGCFGKWTQGRSHLLHFTATVMVRTQAGLLIHEACCVHVACAGAIASAFFWNNMVFHGGSGRKLASTSLMHGVRDASASQKLTPGERTQACLLDPTIVLRTQLPPKRSPGQWTQEGLYCSPPVVRHAGLSQLYCVRGIYYHVVYCYILSQCSQGL